MDRRGQERRRKVQSNKKQPERKEGKRRTTNSGERNQESGATRREGEARHVSNLPKEIYSEKEALRGEVSAERRK